MSSVRSVPSRVDPDGLADLIADARRIVLPRQAARQSADTEPKPVVVIPAASVTLVEGYDDYGV